MIRIENLSDVAQNSLTKALLESSLLFVHSRNKLAGIQRHEVFLKTVFAIIASEAVPCTSEKLAEVFTTKFSKEINPLDIDKAIRRLENLHWIVKKADGYVPDAKIAQIMKDDVADIEQRKERLIQELIEDLQKQLGRELNNETQSKVAENIKLTLNLYVRIHGMEYFISDDDSCDEDISDDEIINQAKDGVDNEVGIVLIEVLSNMIAEPSAEQRSTISLLVKTLIGAQIMQIDPQLSQLQVEKIKDKTFVLDTDFILNCIVKYPKESNEYKKLLSKLRRIGCKLIVPNEVITEIVKHIQNAEGNYAWFRNTYNATDAKEIEEYATNIFVKDYCLSKEKSRCTFKQYIEDKYFDRDNPSSLIESIVEKELHLPLDLDDELKITDDLEVSRAELEKKIRETTRLSPKSKRRDDDEINSLAETDAKLFLYVLSQNQLTSQVNHGDLLSGTSFLITYTAKSIRCAKEMNLDTRFVTRPEILINILYEIGIFDDAKDELFNLFDNPFLTHVINENWETIKKLTNLGVSLHDKGLSKLDRDLGEAMNNYLTQKAEYDKIPEPDRTSEAKLKVAKDYETFLKEVQRKHYKLMPDVQVLANTLTQQDSDIAEERRLKEEALKKYAQKEYRQQHYDDMMAARRNPNEISFRRGGKRMRRFHK